MYLIKDIGLDSNRDVCVRDGILSKMFKPSNRICVSNPFWGMAEVKAEAHADFSQFPKADSENGILLSYANSVNIKWLGGGFRELSFYVSSYQPDKVQGYIVFVPACAEISTSGQKLAGRYATEGVFLLEEGQNLVLDGKVIRVTNGEFVYGE